MLRKADDQRQNMLLREWGLADCTGVSTPMPTSDEGGKEGDQPGMVLEAGRIFTRAVARLHYVGRDRPDIAFASCVLGRAMARRRVVGRVAPEGVPRFARTPPAGCVSSVRRCPEGSLCLGT